MTYKEKYNELFSTYENAIKNLQSATQKLSSDTGLGNNNDLDNYFKINQQYKRAEENFQQFLKYSNADDINPDTEFILPTYIYHVISGDQIEQGVDLNELNTIDSPISLTNDGEVNERYQGTEYKFPVLNLEHGKECYEYL